MVLAVVRGARVRHTRFEGGTGRDRVEAGAGVRSRANRGHLQTFKGLLPESQGQNLALTFLQKLFSWFHRRSEAMRGVSRNVVVVYRGTCLIRTARIVNLLFTITD